MAENEKELFECLSNELKLSPGQIKASAAKGDLSRLTQNMDGDKAKRVESILSDPEKARKILNSPQAQALLKILNQQ